MNKKIISRLCSAVTASAMVLSGLAMFPTVDADAASTVVVDTKKTYQTIRGFGGMNHPEWQSYKGGGDMTEAQVNTAFGNGANQIGLSILRIFVSDNSNEWKNAIPTAKRAKALGATIFATPWNPPASMRSNGTGGPSGGKYVLNNNAEAQYAKHLNDFIKYCNSQGIELNSISVQNEPDWSGDWTYWSPERCANFLANYGKAVTAGTTTKMMSPESFSYNKSYYNAILNNSKAMANCDMFGTHFYGTQRNAMDFPALENSGKEIWMTEVYTDSDHDADQWPLALDVCTNVHNGLVVGNMNAYVWWYIRRSYGLLKENGSISKRGYCMAQYSKFVRPGDVRIGATESPTNGVYVSAYKNNKNQITVVAVNKSGSSYAQEFQVGSGETIMDIDRYRTSSSENLALTENLDNTGSSFFAQLPNESVSTFVITLNGNGQTQNPDTQPTTQTPTQAPSETQPDANGYYFHNTFEGDVSDWSGRGAASVTLSGRTAYEGKESLLVQDRTSAWHGATKALDTSVFQPGKAYSFSADVMYFDGDAKDKFFMKLQYKGSDNETHYSSIAEAEAVKGEWVQLSNTSYTIPADATDVQIYIETAESTNNFYIDDIIGAKEGTKISGAAPVEYTIGDVNHDGVIDSFDLINARRGVATGFGLAASRLAADVNQDGQTTVADLIALSNYILGQTTEFEKAEVPTEAPTEAPASSVAQGRTLAEYVPVVAANVKENEPDDSKQEKGGVQYGTVKAGSYWSKTCNREKKYNVLLPANYDTNKKYPVLYCMHGYWENQDRMIIKGNGTMYTRQIIGNAIASGEAEDMIVVFPDIYSSATQAACSAMDDNNNAAYDNFINDLIKDLMPEIEKNYSIKTGRDNTAITGFSMGGRESLQIGMSRPDLFGYVGAICPAPGATGAFKWNSGEEPHLLFITAGGNDQTVYTIPQGYHENFTKNNVPHVWHYVKNGYHGDNSIHAHMYNFVRAIFKA